MSEHRQRTLSWPLSIDAVWLAMPLFVVAVRTVIQPIPPQDYWWHLVMGRIIDATGTIPSANLFLYTMPVDAPFHDQPWLAQWLMFKVVETVGHVGTVALHLALLLTTWAALAWVLVRRGANPVIVGISLAAAHYMSATTLVPRTQMFAYPCFVAVLLATMILARGGRRRWWCVVLAATVFWANVHGTFVFAAALVGLVGAGVVVERYRNERRLSVRELAVWSGGGAATLVAMMATPFGIENFKYLSSIASATKGAGPAVIEWVPPGLYPQGILFFVALVAGLGILWRSRSEVTAWEVLPYVAFGGFAATSVRGVVWWAFVASIVVVPHASRMWRAPQRVTTATEGVVNSAILAGFVAVTVFAWPGMPLFRVVDPSALFGEGRLADEGDLSVVSAANPANLIEAVRRQEGRIFHDQSAGGFLEWTLTEPHAPKPVAFVDQRLEMLPPALWDDYFDLSRTQPGWDKVVRRHDIKLFLIRRDEQERLVHALERLPSIRHVGDDGPWVLFVRD